MSYPLHHLSLFLPYSSRCSLAVTWLEARPDASRPLQPQLRRRGVNWRNGCDSSAPQAYRPPPPSTESVLRYRTRLPPAFAVNSLGRISKHPPYEIARCGKLQQLTDRIQQLTDGSFVRFQHTTQPRPALRCRRSRLPGDGTLSTAALPRTSSAAGHRPLQPSVTSLSRVLQRSDVISGKGSFSCCAYDVINANRVGGCQCGRGGRMVLYATIRHGRRGRLDRRAAVQKQGMSRARRERRRRGKGVAANALCTHR